MNPVWQYYYACNLSEFYFIHGSRHDSPAHHIIRRQSPFTNEDS
jgi:hypothetical protein